jgi:membrane protein DedA with SNARE-associated domain
VRPSARGEIDLRVGAALTLGVPALLHIHLHLHHHFHGPPFDYAGLAVASVASWVGVPGPGEPVLIAAGVLAARNQLDIATVIGAAWLAAVFGGEMGWLIGRQAGRAVLTAPGPLRPLRIRAVARGEEVFAKHPVIAIALTPSWIAGIHRVRGRIYHPVNAISALLWSCGYGLGAYFVGPTVIDAVDDVGLLTAAGLMVLIAFGVLLEVRRRRRRRREGSGGSGGPGGAGGRRDSDEGQLGAGGDG